MALSKIVVVSDDDQFKSVAIAQLGEGYSVTMTSALPETLKLIEMTPPDLLLIDIKTITSTGSILIWSLLDENSNRPVFPVIAIGNDEIHFSDIAHVVEDTFLKSEPIAVLIRKIKTLMYN